MSFSRVRKRGWGTFFPNFHNRNGELRESNRYRHVSACSNYHNSSWPFATSAGGHRGFAHPSRRWVPREPPRRCYTSLFVDSLPVGTSRDWIHGYFSGVGNVVDVFISRKQRKNSNLAFGFVRFRLWEEALAAIRSLHGSRIKNCEIKVSLAKYPKEGSSWVVENQKGMWGLFNKPGKLRSSMNFAKVINGVRRHQTEGPTVTVSPVISLVDMDESKDKENKLGLEDSSDRGVVNPSHIVDEDSNVKDKQPGLEVSSNNGGLTGPLSMDHYVSEGLVKVQDSECVKVDLGTDICADIEKASATPAGLRPVAMGVVGYKKEACHPGNLRKLMKSRDVANFLGFYGPTKA